MKTIIVLVAGLTAAVTAQQSIYGQCGGISWTSPTVCISGACCSSINAYYYQCLPSCTGGTGPTSTTTTHSVTTTKPPTTTTQVVTSTKSSTIITGTDVALSNVVVFTPPSNYLTPKVLYARSVVLSDGTLLATWENYSPEPPSVYFPIYRSTNKGKTWSAFSQVHDTQNGWGLRWEPHLYVLPSAIGSLPAGTVLIAGNSIPTDLSASKIDIYASTDNGATWKFVSNVATGGEAVPGHKPIWEPFLMVYNNQLLCFYSDERDSAHSQKLSLQVSSNGVSWGAAIDAVAYSSSGARPGMASVAALPNGNYILTYEYGGAPGSSSFPVYYRISSSPLAFNSATGQELSASGTTLNSSPYVVYSSAGGGMIVVSGSSSGSIFVNKNLGSSGSWVQYSTPQPGAYSRSLTVMDDPAYLLLMGAGYQGGNNQVTGSVVKLPGA